MDISLSKEAHIAIRYAIMHAFSGKARPLNADYVIQRAESCFVCGEKGGPYGVESTEMHQTEPGDRVFHHVCSHCFSQQVISTDFVSYRITNIGYFNTSTRQMEHYCTMGQYKNRSEFHVEGKPCDEKTFMSYMMKIKVKALSRRQNSINDSELYFNLSDGSATPNLPRN